MRAADSDNNHEPLLGGPLSSSASGAQGFTASSAAALSQPESAQSQQSQPVRQPSQAICPQCAQAVWLPAGAMLGSCQQCGLTFMVPTGSANRAPPTPAQSSSPRSPTSLPPRPTAPRAASAPPPRKPPEIEIPEIGPPASESLADAEPPLERLPILAPPESLPSEESSEDVQVVDLDGQPGGINPDGIHATGKPPSQAPTAWADPVLREPATQPQFFAPAPSAPAASSQLLLDRVEQVEHPPRRGWANFSSWGLSLFIHMVLLLALGLIALTGDLSLERFILSATISDADQPGEVAEISVEQAFEFTTTEPLTAQSTASSPSELLIQEKLFVPTIEEYTALESAISDVVANAESGYTLDAFSGRDPTLRAMMLKSAGGTEASEAAVARGLLWIANHQSKDGSWQLHAFHQTPACNGQCGGAGGRRTDTGGTALAILPFLGAGQTHRSGQHRDTVSRGLDWLLSVQQPDGHLGGDMYAHGIASIVLCEAFAMTGDVRLGAAAQGAIDYIVKAQHPEGGWRYAPGQPGDLSVVGWQLMALRSGQIAKLEVPSGCFERAEQFLYSVQTDKSSGRFTYMPGDGRATPAMTAEGILCAQYFGWGTKDLRLLAGLDWLLNNAPPNPRRQDIYYWYYATQAFHHAGGESWRQWNLQMRDMLIGLQETEGHQAGSWAPGGGHDNDGGRLFVTALAVCTLEVYYRHQPLYSKEAIRPR